MSSSLNYWTKANKECLDLWMIRMYIIWQLFISVYIYTYKLLLVIINLSFFVERKNILSFPLVISQCTLSLLPKNNKSRVKGSLVLSFGFWTFSSLWVIISLLRYIPSVKVIVSPTVLTVSGLHSWFCIRPPPLTGFCYQPCGSRAGHVDNSIDGEAVKQKQLWMNSCWTGQ